VTRIWVARPRLYLPNRLQRQIENEQELRAWRRRFWAAMAAALAFAILNAIAMSIILHGGGDWAILPGLLSVPPLMWLFDKVAFGVTPDFGQTEEAESDILEAITL